jgi:hypothetical protein
MNTMLQRAANVLAVVGERVVAVAAASWPRSLASREVERWVGDGYERGKPVVVEYLVSFDRIIPAGALGALTRQGFVIGEASSPKDPFVTVCATMKLTAFSLEKTALMLDRVVAPFDGYAAVIGPYRQPDIAPSPAPRVRQSAHKSAHTFGAA